MTTIEIKTPEAARLAAGLLIRELAERSGVPKSVISRYERGECRYFRPKALIKLSKTLNVDYQTLALSVRKVAR